ncbi:MAG: hypothetical protein AMXMBFR84_45890 [Candidatus Hydrogenedentota bacterium]
MRRFSVSLGIGFALAIATACAEDSARTLVVPDVAITQAYEKAATQNVLAAVNPNVFPGYWSVCADGIGFGFGNSYPALDGHQMADALLHLGQVDVVKANWDYVKTFQRSNGQLPFAILPDSAGKEIGPEDSRAPVDANGGLYRHWVKADPLRALGYTTYIQNADVLFRFTLDNSWLQSNIKSINLAADYLASLMAEDGKVGGAGYYVERPSRVEYDGVTQGHAMDALQRLAALNALLGNTESSEKYRQLADRIQAAFQTHFWAQDRFAEYIHPDRGAIATHGFTDTDWTAIATGIARQDQVQAIWPQLRNEARFRYNGMPTGIATHPEKYESWEFSYDDRMDLAAMGRVWYIECWARARMGDAEGLVESIQQVCKAGKDAGYYWRERYGAQGGYGAEKYCEYPANLIRVVNRFLLGVERNLDGSLSIAPCVPETYWKAGFGQALVWRSGRLEFRFQDGQISGKYLGKEQVTIRARIAQPGSESTSFLTLNGEEKPPRVVDRWIEFDLPGAQVAPPVTFAAGWR